MTIAWFFLPAVNVEFFLLNRSFTFWEFLAMESAPLRSRSWFPLDTSHIWD